MAALIVLLSLLAYILVGAFVSYTLYRLHAITGYRCDEDLSGYCVVIGIFWPITSPFAFAIFFAKEGFPKRR